MMDLAETSRLIQAWVVTQGWENDPSFLEQCAMFHTEVSEAIEHWRKGYEPNEIFYSGQDVTGLPKPDGIPIELADVVIRILETCARYDIDLEEAILMKMAYNNSRPPRGGGKRI